MRIGLLTASVSRRAGGIFDGVRRLAEGLRLSGVEVRVFGLWDADTQRDLGLWDGIPVFAGRVAGPAAFGYCPSLLSRLRGEEPDLVHLQGLWMYPSVVCARWNGRTGRPYVVSPHGMLDPWALRMSAWKKRLAAWLYENRNLHRAACLHALCEAEKAAIRAYGLRNPVCVIPNGVDLPEATSGRRRSWEDERTAGHAVLLYLGRLHPKKNLVRLLEAWALAQRKGPQACRWRLVLAGWDQGGYEARLRQAAEELGVADSVWFLGPQFGEGKDATLGRADSFVLPSLSEGLPVAVLEAWAYGLPVLMTPECNLPEGFAAGAAIRVSTDAEGIARGLMELFEVSEPERRAMGERGRRLVQEKFSWPKIARQMKGVYEWVLGGGPRPGCVAVA